MRNALNLFIAAVLMAGTASAQTTTIRDSIAMDDLLSQMESAQVADNPTPEAVAELERNREQFLQGEFYEAQQGIQKVLESDPDNQQAGMSLLTPPGRDHRTAEIQGLEAVDAAWSTDLVLRSYALASDAREKMSMGDTPGVVNVQDLFPQVTFPKGSKAIYQPKMEILFVRNTSKNLEVLEAILDATGVLKDSGDVDQVEIETKFVEVSEGTLEELGFQWNFTDPNHVEFGGEDMEVSDGPDGLFADALRGSPTGSSPDLPFTRRGELGDGTTAAAAGAWNSFRVADTFSTAPDSLELYNDGNDPFDLLITALDQSNGADVLSAPRIVTRSGEEATIRVGERHYFPEVYEGDASQATMLYISYEDFEEKLLGVEMTVTPEVDGDQIQLALNPTITELVGWQNWQLAATDSIYNHRQNSVGQQYRHPPVVAKLPIFKKRAIETEIIITDGGTVGMGGLISENVQSFEDKVPVLGSIPLVGRFFRNEGDRVMKLNLLMFVTAKKMEPTGKVSTSRTFE